MTFQVGSRLLHPESNFNYKHWINAEYKEDFI